MNKILLLSGAVLLFILIASCKHDNDCHRNKYIIAGEKGGCIIYHDFVPDIEVKADSSHGFRDTLEVDLNSDNKNDLRIISQSLAVIESLNGLRFNGLAGGFSGNGMTFVNLFNNSEKINDSIWSSLPFLLSVNPKWQNTDHKYMGVQFINGKDTTLGWVCMSIQGSSDVIIYDCAYQK